MLNLVDPCRPRRRLLGWDRQAGGYEGPRGRGIFAPGTTIAVHRGDQSDGQGIRDGYRWSGEPGTCPTSPPHRVRDIGTAAEVGSRSVSDASDRRAASSRNGGRNYPGMGWASSQKQSPGSCASRGSSCRAGGWGVVVSATLMQTIVSPSSTAKSSVGYRVSGAANEGVVHEEGG